MMRARPVNIMTLLLILLPTFTGTGSMSMAEMGFDPGSSDSVLPPTQLPPEYRNETICRQCECSPVSQNITCIGIIEPHQLVTLPGWTRELYIWECSLPRVTRDAFSRARAGLRKVQIWGSELTSVGPGAFDGLETLQLLDFSENKLFLELKHHAKLFQTLTSLRYLNLSNTNLDDFAVLDETNFPPNIELAELNLSGVYVKGLSRSFRLPNTARLDLSDMPIEYFYGEYFSFQNFDRLKVQVAVKFLKSLNLDRCGAVLKPDFFHAFKHLESLSASPSVMDYIQLDVLQERWHRLRALNLTLARFHPLPSDSSRFDKTIWRHFPPSLQTLDISRMLLKEVRIEHIHASLEELRLSRNELTDLPYLRNLPNLRYLDISHNRLFAVPFPPDFTTTSQLTHVDLSHNQISTLIFESFLGMPNLNTLKLSHNKLRYFGSQMLSVLPQIETLDLAENQLEYFDFNRTDSLTTLSLAQNKLRGIRAVQNCCPKLSVLNLARNRALQKAGADWCSGRCEVTSILTSLLNLTSLVNLDLTRTGLLRFPTRLIAQLPNIRYLSIAENDISSYGLENELITLKFNNLRLDFLNLSANSISAVGPSLTDMLAGSWLIELDLSRNDFFCTCQLVAAFKVLQYKLVRFFGIETTEELFYECYSETEDLSYSVKQYIYQPRTRLHCPEAMNAYLERPDKASLTIYTILSMCAAAVVFTVVYVAWTKNHLPWCSRAAAIGRGKIKGFAAAPGGAGGANQTGCRSGRPRMSRQYSSVDYVVLETSGPQGSTGSNPTQVSREESCSADRKSRTTTLQQHINSANRFFLPTGGNGYGRITNGFAPNYDDDPYEYDEEDYDDVIMGATAENPMLTNGRSPLHIHGVNGTCL